MKATGVVRKLDALGRIVIPIELRKTMGIEISDSLEIFTEGGKIILQKYAPGCVFCGESKETIMNCGKMVCTQCAKALARTLKEG
jgi:transcriptional pleiotropic regulator of transition state genes